ncbi:hypothetical protein FF38_01259 [Lucilia cuprina]|uniref:Uncharacterized protein n=1 Tax=Lucilia cuprina TaxID=7375 RepID=A0A0L0CN21_LUCCU|nr:hypothetical protein FF38_01259 [Lucilia cuprina]
MLNVRGAARQKVKTATKLFSHITATALKRCAQLGRNENILSSEPNVQNCEDRILEFQAGDLDVTLSQQIFSSINEIPIDDLEKLMETTFYISAMVLAVGAAKGPFRRSHFTYDKSNEKVK